jgi:hypothetical protein
MLIGNTNYIEYTFSYFSAFFHLSYIVASILTSRFKIERVYYTLGFLYSRIFLAFGLVLLGLVCAYENIIIKFKMFITIIKSIVPLIFSRLIVL